jgi:hypothetical protein
MNQISVSQKQFEIEERRRQVASLVAKSMTEREIAAQLNISQSTIHRDIEALREMSNQFVYDLAKSDLAFFYSQAMTGIDGATRGIWKMLDDPDNKEIDMKRLAAFKTLIDAHKVKFELINAGPSVMALRSMTERLERVERNETTQVPP